MVSLKANFSINILSFRRHWLIPKRRKRSPKESLRRKLEFIWVFLWVTWRLNFRKETFVYKLENSRGCFFPSFGSIFEFGIRGWKSLFKKGKYSWILFHCLPPIVVDNDSLLARGILTLYYSGESSEHCFAQAWACLFIDQQVHQPLVHLELSARICL